MSEKAYSITVWPRLLYWSDLPVSPTHAGAMLMHRLLKGWPAERLMVVTSGALKGPDQAKWPQMAAGAAAAGKEDFGYENVFGKFCAALSGSKENQDKQR
jgi:hypothetical protein